MKHSTPMNSASLNSASVASTSAGRRWAQWLGTAAVVAALVGCGSSVKLDEVPVTDRSGTPVQSGGAGAGAGTGADSRGVAPVSVAPGQIGQPPASLSRTIYFDFDSFTVRPEFAATLEGHARFLNADRSRSVVLEGHTDERGGREYNLALGQKRAEAVRRALSLLGVSDAQMEAVSFGKEKPANAGSTEEAFSQNRRVELSYR